MPIRSSLINTLFLFQYLFFIIFLGYLGRALKFQKLDILGFLSIPYIAITIFRTWLVATLTFQKNGANRQRRNADEEREQLRQIEIQEALRKRQTRNHGRIGFSTDIFDSLFFNFQQKMTILMQLLLRMQQNRGNVKKHQILQMYGLSESGPRIVIVKKLAL